MLGAPPEDHPPQAEPAGRADEALRESEARFRAMFENSGSGMALVDMAGHPVECNPALQKILGYTEEELRGMAFTEFTHPDDRELDWELYGELTAGKREKYEIEKRYITKDGRVVWVNLIATIVKDEGGRPKYAIGMIQDITERRRAEEELRESEERFKTFMDNSPSVAFIKDEEGRFLYINRTFARFFDAEPGAFVGKTDFDVWPEETAAQLRAHDRAALQSGRTTEVVEVVPAPDGAPHLWLTFKFPLREKGGRLCLAGMGVDITESKRAEEELRRLSERLQLATRAARMGIWDWDIVRDELVWDDASYELFGIRREDFTGAYDAWASTLAPEDFERATAAVQAALRGEREFDPEFRIVRADGSVRFIKSDSQTFYDEAGRPVRMVGLSYDITGRRLTEEKLRWSEERLRLILDSAAEGIFGVDLEGHCTFCNAASLRLLGYDRADELLGREMHALISPRRADGCPYPAEECPAVHALRSAEAAFSDADVFWRKDGTYFPVSYWSHPMFREGEHVGAVLTFLDITERKLAEESLRLSEERFAKAFHASPEPITIFRHRDGTLLEVNERWTAVYGFTREEAVGRPSTELSMFRREDREQIRGLLERQHSIRDFELDLKTKQGELRRISLSAEQIVISDELCNIFLHRDITERRRAEEQNRRLIHDLAERVKELTALHHAARVLQDAGKSVPELLREIVRLLPPAWQYPEVTAARIRFGEVEFKTANFSETPWTLAAEFTAGRSRGTVEVVYLEERPARYFGPFLSEERSLLDSLAEMIQTALNRRLTEEELRASEERFIKAFQASPAPIAILRDRDRIFLEVNESWEKVFGYSRGETLGRTALELDFFGTDDRDRLRALGEREGFLRDEELNVRTKRGEVRHVTMSAERFLIDGELCNICLFRDVTERKQAEEELKDSRERLRALSESLRRAKEEEGIRIARELHDELGAALTSLKWSLTRLGRDGAAESGARVGEMVGLVDATINTVRRISSELRPGVLDDLGLIPAIEWHAQQFQANTGIACRFDSQIENVGLSREQATTVFRIFQEALTNVLRHARASKINVLVEEEEEEFVLEVSDNGRGITEAEKLGTNSLGLLGMRERAHSIGGSIELNGTAGRGTTLIFRLPLPG